MLDAFRIISFSSLEGNKPALIRPWVFSKGLYSLLAPAAPADFLMEGAANFESLSPLVVIAQ